MMKFILNTLIGLFVIGIFFGLVIGFNVHLGSFSEDWDLYLPLIGIILGSPIVGAFITEG